MCYSDNGWGEKMNIVKVCTKCGLSKPATLEFFYAHSKAKGGLNPACKHCHISRSLKRYKTNRQELIKRNKISHEKYKEDRARQAKEYRYKAKLEVLLHYSNEALCCACLNCVEDGLEFLSIDHIGGGGTKHRKLLNGRNIYTWLRAQGYPDGYRVLCMNCNFALGHYERCPHELEGTNIGNDFAI